MPLKDSQCDVCGCDLMVGVPPGLWGADVRETCDHCREASPSFSPRIYTVPATKPEPTKRQIAARKAAETRRQNEHAAWMKRRAETFVVYSEGERMESFGPEHQAKTLEEVIFWLIDYYFTTTTEGDPDHDPDYSGPDDMTIWRGGSLYAAVLVGIDGRPVVHRFDNA